MKLSHSKLNCILSCPMTYYLRYVEGIYQKVEKTALSLGSAVHWGIEHSTEDLSDYYNKKGNFKQQNNYTDEQLLAESMVHGYLKNKDRIFNELLDNSTTKLLEETHEIYLTAKLKSYMFEIPTEFVGIIDLLLLTDKGFIIVDYKTSSNTPNWDDYLDQIYRYIMLIRSAFPDTPIYKLAIINLRKTKIYRKKGENEVSFKKRLQAEYDVNDDNYISHHIFEEKTLDKQHIDDYITNLCHMCDFARLIDEKKMWYINFGNAISVYGKSEFYNIFYKTNECHLLYNISDKVYNKDLDEISSFRECNQYDMLCIDKSNVLNHYSLFKEELELFLSNNYDIDTFTDYLHSKYIFDEVLIQTYIETYLQEMSKS